MQVSHARPGSELDALEHAAIVLISRELAHTYPVVLVNFMTGADVPPGALPIGDPGAMGMAVTDLAKWAAGAVQVLRTIAEADEL